MSRMAPIDSLFVCEYLCSGLWPEPELPDSLYREGYLMWSALLQDLSTCLSKKQGFRSIVTLCDSRIACPEIPGVTFLQTKTVTEANEYFDEQIAITSETLLIAPEIDHIQQQYLQRIQGHERGHYLCSLEAAQRTGDKWAFHEWCLAQQIPVLPTCLLRSVLDRQSLDEPVVLKPRWGAGSAGVTTIRNQLDLQSWLQQNEDHDSAGWIVQPEIAGPFLSQGILIDGHGRPYYFPVGLQNFAGVTYQGGTIPYRSALTVQITDCSREIVKQLSGLSGLLGIDYALTNDPLSPFVVMELNPRMTTAYLGYRQLCDQNLAEVLLGENPDVCLSWKSAAVNFTTSGPCNQLTFDLQ